jgi:hypothetical protein
MLKKRFVEVPLREEHRRTVFDTGHRVLWKEFGPDREDVTEH